MRYATFALCAVLCGAAAPATIGPITWSSGAATRVRIAIPADARVDDHQQGAKLILDVHGVRPDPQAKHSYDVRDGVVESIRVGDHPPSTVRVVLDLQTDGKCRISRDASGALIVEAPKGSKISAPRPPSPPPSRPVSKATGKKPAATQADATLLPPPPAGRPAPGADRINDIRIAPAMELTVLEDTAQDVPFVLQRYNGSIGFGVAKAAVIERMFRSPDWIPAAVTGGSVRLSDYFALQFADDKSDTVEDLRKRYSIERTLAAYALFPRTFVDTLHAEIRQAAAKQAQSGEVTAATVMFTLLGSGVEVKSVSLR